MKLASVIATMAGYVKPVTKQEEEIEVTVPVSVVPDDPIWITTPEGAISIYGSKLISKKDLQILATALHSPDLMEADARHNCRSIIIRDDNWPRDVEDNAVMGAADPNFKVIGINLQEVFLATVNDMMETKHYSMLCCWHHQLHAVMLHELRHLMLEHTRSADTDLNKERDDAADAWADEVLIWLAKNADIEPAPYHEGSFFAQHVMKMIAEMKEGEVKETQTHMLENHIMFTVPAGDDPVKTPAAYINSFKTVMQGIAGGAWDDPEWQTNTNGLVNSDQWIRENGSIMPATTYSSAPSYDGDDTPFEEEVAYAVDNGGTGANMFYGGGQPAQDRPNFVQPTPPFQPVAPVHHTPPNQPIINPCAPTPVVAQYHGFPDGKAVDQSQVARIIHSVYNKCRDFMFGACGQLINSEVGFSNPDAVMHTPIQLTPEEQQIVVAMDTLDANGRFCEGVSTTQGLRGQVLKNTKLPSYLLYLNINGQVQKRRILPQNPARQNQSAQDARNGRKICYVYEGDRRLEEQLKAQGKFGNLYFKSVDGQPFAPCN